MSLIVSANEPCYQWLLLGANLRTLIRTEDEFSTFLTENGFDHSLATMTSKYYVIWVNLRTLIRTNGKRRQSERAQVDGFVSLGRANCLYTIYIYVYIISGETT